MNDELLERLASHEHVQWMEWAKSVSDDIRVLVEIINKNVSLDDLDSNQRKVIENNIRRVENWPKLMVDYEDLSEDMKEKDRKYAREVYEIFEKSV